MTNFINEFTIFLLQTIFWYAVAYLVMAFLKNYLSQKNQRTQAVIEHITSRVHTVRVERHADMYFWYDTENDNFIVQGRNGKEIQTLLHQYWQKHIFLLEKEQLILVGPEFEPISIKNITLQDLTK